jgi:phosphohistidine swiveling domain-containing protein
MSEKYIARSSQIAARMLGGEIMVMSSVDSTFFTLNEVATAIWQAADGRTPLADIVAKNVCAEFDVDLEIAHRDAEQFVNELSHHGILLVSDRPFDSADSAGPDSVGPVEAA